VKGIENKCEGDRKHKSVAACGVNVSSSCCLILHDIAQDMQMNKHSMRVHKHSMRKQAARMRVNKHSIRVNKH